MKTTLNKIARHFCCEFRWQKRMWAALLKHLGKTQADDEPLLLSEIVKIVGLDNALWCTRATDGYDKELRLYAVWCARQVQHLMIYERSIRALDAAELYANNEASCQDLEYARREAEIAVEFAEAISATDWFAAKSAEHATLENASFAAWFTLGSCCNAAMEKASNPCKAGAAIVAAQEAEFLRICDEIEKMEQEA